MCLAVPAKILEKTKSKSAVVDMAGAKKEISLLMLDDAKVGDFVLVHAGFAISKMDKKDAEAELSLLKEIGL
jgi:hydrogenase expression/formation protein HypC